MNQVEESNPVVEENKSLSWFGGFKQIITQPSDLSALHGANVMKVSMAAILLMGFSYTITAYISWMNPELRQQGIYMMTFLLRESGQKIPEIGTTFEFTKTLGFAMMKSGVFPLLLVSLLFNTLHRMLTSEPLKFVAVLAICAFSMSITAVGMIATMLLQLSTKSINSLFSFAGFVSAQEHYFLFGFLSQIDVFLVWQFIAIGTAIASFTLLPASKKITLIASAILLAVLLFGAMAYFSYSLAMK
jgi:hypothetical protein